MKNKRSLGIYIHIPFCKSKCHYCDFCSSPANDELKNKYVESLINEISFARTREFLSNHTVDTIYFGGGTPTCLTPKVLKEILHSVFDSYSVSNDTEISIECNPGTVNHDDLSELKSAGFNRLSIGLQTTHTNELKALGRIHDLKAFDSTFNSARKSGFNNISLDLMYGIPYQTVESFKETLLAATEYSPEHISAYSLKIEPGTNFYVNKNNLILPDEDAEYNMYNSAIMLLSSAGYEHYEISNYAKKGYRSKHNLKYWNCDDYVGFGISAHSCVETLRYSVTTSIEKYIASEGICASLEESLNEEEFAEEYIMMRMRLSDGICLNEYSKKFGKAFDEKYLSRMLPFVKSGHIIYNKNSGNICFSKEGMYVSNYILSSILDLE